MCAFGNALNEGVEYRAVQAAQIVDAFGSQLVAGNEFHLFSPFLFEGPDCRSLFWAQRTDHPHEKSERLLVV